MPVVIPVTIPVVPIAATMGLLLLHAPPGVGFVKATDEPAHRVAVPLTAPGGMLTVTVLVVAQPAAVVVYVMVAVPAVIPLTMPVALPTVAMAAAPLVHTPPGVPVVRTVILPMHNIAVPLMGSGSG